MDAGVIGILIAHLRAFGSGELKTYLEHPSAESFPGGPSEWFLNCG